MTDWNKGTKKKGHAVKMGGCIFPGVVVGMASYVCYRGHTNEIAEVWHMAAAREMENPGPSLLLPDICLI